MGERDWGKGERQGKGKPGPQSLLSGRPRIPSPWCPTLTQGVGGLGLNPVEKKWLHIFRDVLNIVLATQRLLHSQSS